MDILRYFLTSFRNRVLEMDLHYWLDSYGDFNIYVIDFSYVLSKQEKD